MFGGVSRLHTFLLYLCSGLLGLIILAHFVIGWTLATVLLQKRAHVAQFCAERWNIDALFSGRQDGAAAPISGTNAATATAANNEPWKALRIDSDLDRAVDSVSYYLLAHIDEIDSASFYVCLYRLITVTNCFYYLDSYMIHMAMVCRKRIVCACLKHCGQHEEVYYDGNCGENIRKGV